MKRSAREPRRWAASATAWAWLPALAATTPRPSWSRERRPILWKTPRTLNDPVSWRHSAFSTTGAPNLRESSPAGSTDVSRTSPAISSAARSTSAAVTACSEGGRAPPWRPVIRGVMSLCLPPISRRNASLHVAERRSARITSVGERTETRIVAVSHQQQVVAVDSLIHDVARDQQGGALPGQSREHLAKLARAAPGTGPPWARGAQAARAGRSGRWPEETRARWPPERVPHRAVGVIGRG